MEVLPGKPVKTSRGYEVHAVFIAPDGERVESTIKARLFRDIPAAVEFTKSHVLKNCFSIYRTWKGIPDVCFRCQIG